MGDFKALKLGENKPVAEGNGPAEEDNPAEKKRNAKREAKKARAKQREEDAKRLPPVKEKKRTTVADKITSVEGKRRIDALTNMLLDDQRANLAKRTIPERCTFNLARSGEPRDQCRNINWTLSVTRQKDAIKHGRSWETLNKCGSCQKLFKSMIAQSKKRIKQTQVELEDSEEEQSEEEEEDRETK